MAYALGNDWHIGVEGEKWKPKIAVHEISQGDVKVGGKWNKIIIKQGT